MMNARSPLSLLLVIALLLAPLQGVWAGAWSEAGMQGVEQQPTQGHHCEGKQVAPDCCKHHGGGCDQMSLDCQAHCASALVFVITQIPTLVLAPTGQDSRSDYRIHCSGFRPDLEHRPPKTA